MPAHSAGVRFRPFTPAQVEAVRATLSDLVTISNPLDYHIFIWNQPERLRATFTAVMACGWDLACLVLDFPRTDSCSDADWQVSLAAWEQARDATRGRAAVLATLPDCLPESVAEALIAAGIVPLLGIDDALAAAEAAADIGAAQAAALPEPLLRRWPWTVADARRVAGKLLLAEYGVRHPGGRLVRNAGRSCRAAPRSWATRSWSRRWVPRSRTRASSVPWPWGCAMPARVRRLRPRAWRIWARRCWSSLW